MSSPLSLSRKPASPTCRSSADGVHNWSPLGRASRVRPLLRHACRVANVWLKSRIPQKTARLTDHWVERAGGGYADIVWAGRRFRFSHASVMRDEAGNQETWLVYEDVGGA